MVVSASAPTAAAVSTRLANRDMTVSPVSRPGPEDASLRSAAGGDARAVPDVILGNCPPAPDPPPLVRGPVWADAASSFARQVAARCRAAVLLLHFQPPAGPGAPPEAMGRVCQDHRHYFLAVLRVVSAQSARMGRRWLDAAAAPPPRRDGALAHRVAAAAEGSPNDLFTGAVLTSAGPGAARGRWASRIGTIGSASSSSYRTSLRTAGAGLTRRPGSAKGNDDHRTFSGRAGRGGVPGRAGRRVRQPRPGTGGGRHPLTGHQHDRVTIGRGYHPGHDGTGHDGTARPGGSAALSHQPAVGGLHRPERRHGRAARDDAHLDQSLRRHLLRLRLPGAGLLHQQRLSDGHPADLDESTHRRSGCARAATPRPC